MCTMWIDGFAGVAHHVTQNADFAVAAAADPAALRAHARNRGWTNLWYVLDLTPGGRGDWYASLDDGARRR
jgi:predicted dithiol-disulfide oxidoreductase (DUF899 family)